jgi:hypothetical protein
MGIAAPRRRQEQILSADAGLRFCGTARIQGACRLAGLFDNGISRKSGKGENWEGHEFSLVPSGGSCRNGFKPLR